ncbi:MAG: CcoQ/FixQ family Cbb3-type cytochrome c oxidase assembly chaperone [Pseudobacteriovorax sp.]|nr:CcoQ/FixQ family Cbb3-type cytochrome c oxidase assembly chaperone [Pseudobacteriovorax sp.]
MKHLIKSALEAGEFGYWGVTALLLFFSVMIGVGIWIMRPGSKAYYQYISSLALKGERDHEQK